jgi:hypothetical protein
MRITMHNEGALLSADPVDTGTQSDLICVRRLMAPEQRLAAHIGGSGASSARRAIRGA